MATLKNEQIRTIVNTAYNEMTGITDIQAPLDLSAFCDNGSNAITDDREKFTKALLGVLTRTIYTDSSYRSEYKDVFYEDSEKFGAIVQMIHAEMPDVIEDSAWKDFTSGVTTVGQYTVYLPVVDNKLYNKSTSWALPLTISGEQMDTAFRNETELRSFINYLFMCLDNKIAEHMENMNDENRNNFIAEKILYAQNPEAKGVHVFDLVKEYALEKGLTTATRNAMLNDREFLAWSSAKISEFTRYFKKQTSLFNTEQKVRFTPSDRLVCQILGRFETKMTSIGYADTRHEEYIKLPLHETTPWWQASGDLSFDDISALHIKTSTGTVNTSGVVGLLCDKWAILHTIRKNRVASEYFDIENLTHYEYQHRDSYMNNLTMNAIVFVMNDYNAAA